MNLLDQKREVARRDPATAQAVPIEPVPTAPWPDPMAEDAFIGPLGDYTRFIEPYTEADPAAILLQSLVLFGNAVGRGPHFLIGNSVHHCNLFAVIVGSTSSGKKGTSWSDARSLFQDCCPSWLTRIESGLSSGEGLIQAVRDPKPDIEDPGAPDRRLMICEPEFSRVLKQSDRQGNILSAVLRQAWDGGELQVLTRSNPVRATGAHVSLVGHITPEELQLMLSSTDAANGLANRFVWGVARRSKPLPNPPRVPEAEMNYHRNSIKQSLQSVPEIELLRTSSAEPLWEELYHALDEEIPGIVGQLTARGKVQLVRLALIYALTTGARQIEVRHLRAASAVWDYCSRSVEWLFGGAKSDDVLELIQSTPHGISRTQLYHAFGRHMKAAELTRRLNDLHRRGLIRGETIKTLGRSSQLWYPVMASREESP